MWETVQLVFGEEEALEVGQDADARVYRGQRIACQVQVDDLVRVPIQVLFACQKRGQEREISRVVMWLEGKRERRGGDPSQAAQVIR